MIDNYQLLKELHVLNVPGLPVLVGVSRKSMIADMLDRNMDDRIHASVALAVYAAQHGAAIVRVHDVQATRDALRVTARVLASTKQQEG